jgi:ribonuclease HII
LKIVAAHWHELALVLAAMVVIAALAYAWLFGRKKDSKEVERERRSYLNRIGRIVDGQVVEIVERAAEQDTDTRGRAAKLKAMNKTINHRMLLYSYSISGVTYEAAQDITGLEEQVCLERVVAGQPVGVKYDPSNPSNSILVADDWSGLR